MKLDRLVLVNWGQLRPGNYELGNMTLLTGPTGAGKSTMLDALQTIMTAAYQGIVAYNPGQEEVSAGQRRGGKSKRTLESFIAGAEYSRFSRPAGAHGYVAAVFRPSPEETSAKVFTALAAVSARVDGNGERREARLERLALIIVEDTALSVEEFFEELDDGRCVPVENIVRHLKAKHPKVMAYDDHKRDYLCGLYGRFRGRGSIPWEEAQNAARAWSQSIAYKPMGSVHELVREDILEFDAKALQENITVISDLMRQVTNLKQEGQRLEATMVRLRDLDATIGKTAGAFELLVQLELLQARMRLAADEEKLAAERRRIQDEKRSIEQHGQSTKVAQLQKEAADRSRISLAAQLSGIPAHLEKQTLDERLQRATSNARAKLNELRAGLTSAAQIGNTAETLVKRELPEQLTRLRTSVAAVGRALGATQMDRLAGLLDAVASAHSDKEPVPSKLFQLGTSFEGVDEDLRCLHDALVGAEDSVLTAAVAESADLEQQEGAASKQRDDLMKRRGRLAAGGSDYNRDTVLALERIRENSPEAGVQVLCDLVEPVSNEWQQAVEGYLDNARFNLIVKPELEARVIDFLRSWGSRSKVIQGKHCLDRADATRVPRDSIIHELRTDHPIAQAYLIEQYGSVVKVETSEQLRTTPRGVTRDGKGSGSRTMFVGERKELVFGRKARELALQATTEQLEILDQEKAELQRRKAAVAECRRVLGNLRQPAFDAQPLALHAADIEEARSGLDRLDLREVEGLRKQLAELEENIAAFDKQIQEGKVAQALSEKAIAAAGDVIRQVNANRDARLRDHELQIQRLKHLCEVNPARDYSTLSKQVQDLLESKTHESSSLTSRINDARRQPDTLLGDVREMLVEYNATVRQDERFHSPLPHLPDATAFDPYYGPLVVLGRSVSAMRDNLETVGLYNNRLKVQDVEHSFHDVFTKQFCVLIKSKVDEGVRTLRHLNAELAKLKFGTDRFSIDWSKWEPEYQDYYGFFSAVTVLADSPESVDLFGETELSPKHVEVRDRLVKLLLDPDQERAGRELLRISDYRNYRRYEIWNDSDSGGRIALSTWGTGSGGQLETPAYIVRAAVVTNRLKLFDKGASLKLLVNDESFSKMDEARARAVLRYLRDGLGLQVISAMPTRSAGGLRPEFDREYSYSRVKVPENGELDFILECDERVFRQDRMRELWERQREQVREQAKLKFDLAEPPTSHEPMEPAP